MRRAASPSSIRWIASTWAPSWTGEPSPMRGRAFWCRSNCSDEPQKGGVEPDGLPALLDGLRALARLEVIGLMTMSALTDDTDEQRRAFRRLRDAAGRVRARGTPPARAVYGHVGRLSGSSRRRGDDGTTGDSAVRGARGMTASPALHDRVAAAAEAVRARTSLHPEIAIILGTGLGGLAKEIQVETEIPYGDIPGFPLSTVETHAGQAAGRHARGPAGAGDAGPVPSLRGIRPSAGDVPDPGAARARRPHPGSLQRLRRDEPAVGARRSGAAQRSHQPARRQPARRAQRRTAGSAFPRHVRALRSGAAGPGARRGAGAGHRAPGRRVCRGAGPEPGDAGGVPHAAGDGRRRGGHVHRPRGDRGGAPGHAGRRVLDHHRPVPARRAGAGGHRPHHRDRVPRRAASHQAHHRRWWSGWPDGVSSAARPRRPTSWSGASSRSGRKRDSSGGRWRPNARARRSCSTRGRPPRTAARASITSSPAPSRTCSAGSTRCEGKSVTRIAGWDTHGLPVEIEVEKELKLNGKKDDRGVRRRGVQRPRARERLQVPGGVGVALRPDRLLARLRAPLRHLHQRLHRDRCGGCWAGCTSATCCTAGTGCCPTARAAARCSRATSSRRATRTSPPTRSTSRSRWMTTPAASCWCGPPRRGRCSPTSRWRCIPDLEYGEYQVGDRHLCARDRRGPASPAARRRARRLLRRRRRGAPSPGASWSACATGARSTSCRCRTIARRGSSSPATSSPPTTAPDWSTWRRRSAPTTTRPGSDHGLALVRPVAPDGTFTGTSWPEHRGPAGHRQGDQRPDHRAAQARRPLAPDRAATPTAIRTAGAAPAR